MSGFGKEHDDMWDDTELIDSWNEALDEYKKYHSMAARGEMVNVEDIPKAEEEIEAADAVDDTNVNMKQEDVVNSSKQQEDAAFASTNSDPPAQVQPNASAGAQIGMTLPSHIQDESLRNLMMSWYYAGYYTGLHEGGQRGCQTCSTSKPAT